MKKSSSSKKKIYKVFEKKIYFKLKADPNSSYSDQMNHFK